MVGVEAAAGGASAQENSVGGKGDTAASDFAGSSAAGLGWPPSSQFASPLPA